ncbi:MAG: Na/Pi cotransporter family protein, partial [Ekhidna sp.]|nr:Na/Pi cotransporter family protein [Ekhidna sp.]
FNRDKIKFWGEVLVGFALLFMGLALLKDSVPDLKTNPEILEFLSNYTDLGYLSIILFVGIGTVVTVVVQSSSAAMALTLVMANNGWIPFELAAAMVLGENIGTTITANLAAMVGNVHAKRAALSHLIFNIFGVIWILILIRPALSLVDLYLTSNGTLSPFVAATSIPIALSIFHSTFNILNTGLLIWFVNFIARVVTRTIKNTGDDEFQLEYISTGMMNTAELSIEEARKETVRMGQITQKMSKQYRHLITEEKPKKQGKLLKKIREYEVMTDRMEHEISEYLMKVSTSGTLSNKSTIRVTNLLSAINDLERIGDLFFQMSRDVERILNSDKKFKNKQVQNLIQMLNLIDDALTIMVNNLDTDGPMTLETALNKESEINDFRNSLRKDLTKYIEKDKYDPQRDGWYKDLFHLCEKIGDHAINVSEAMTGERERELKDDPGE